ETLAGHRGLGGRLSIRIRNARSDFRFLPRARLHADQIEMWRRRVGVQRVRFCTRSVAMNTPGSRNTIVIPVAAAPMVPPDGGILFRSSIGWGGGGEGGATKGVRAGVAWHNKPSRPSAMRREDGSNPYRFAFGLLYLFTLLLYARPNDLIPAMGTFPL